MKYNFKINNPHQHFIEISAEFNVNDRSTISLNLPSWRPGRYELGNFAKNVKDLIVKDNLGSILNFTKTSKDQWLVNTAGVETVIVTYLYYANALT